MDNWIVRDLRYIWHPYTQMKDCESLPPILIEKADGIKLYDDKGNFYYDTISSWWCNVHGHNHPKIKAAIKEQLDCLEHVLFAGSHTSRPFAWRRNLFQSHRKILQRFSFPITARPLPKLLLRCHFNTGGI